VAPRQKPRYEPPVRQCIAIEELSEGMLVWFLPDEFGPRVGLIVKLTKRGSEKADIIWQKSGESYTVKRTQLDRIQSKVPYASVEKAEEAVKKYCQRVLKDGATPTEAATAAAMKFV
jgi:hypothetical protein